MLHISSLSDTSLSISLKVVDNSWIILQAFGSLFSLGIKLCSKPDLTNLHLKKRTMRDSEDVVYIKPLELHVTFRKMSHTDHHSPPPTQMSFIFLTKTKQTLEQHMTFICIHLCEYSTAVSSHLPFWIIHEERILGGMHVSFTYLTLTTVLGSQVMGIKSEKNKQHQQREVWIWMLICQSCLEQVVQTSTTTEKLQADYCSVFMFFRLSRPSTKDMCYAKTKGSLQRSAALYM